MKSSDFADLLKHFSATAESVEATEVAADWAQLAQAFCVQPAAKSGEICKLISTSGVESRRDPAVSRLLANLICLQHLLQSFSKKQHSASLVELQTALLASEGRRLSDIVDAVDNSLNSAKAKPNRTSARKPGNPEASQNLMKRLEMSLGDEREFKLVFEEAQELKLSFADLKSLAKKFTGSTARNKDHALQLIWSRHASLMESRAKDAAIGGRTAA